LIVAEWSDLLKAGIRVQGSEIRYVDSGESAGMWDWDGTVATQHSSKFVTAAEMGRVELIHSFLNGAV
jgi:hypothetical protein